MLNKYLKPDLLIIDVAVRAGSREIKGPFRRACETRRERNGTCLMRPIRIQPRPIRSDRGWCPQRDRRPSAPYLFYCRLGATHPQTQVEARVAAPGAPQDSIQ